MTVPYDSDSADCEHEVLPSQNVYARGQIKVLHSLVYTFIHYVAFIPELTLTPQESTVPKTNSYLFA